MVKSTSIQVDGSFIFIRNALDLEVELLYAGVLLWQIMYAGVLLLPIRREEAALGGQEAEEGEWSGRGYITTHY